MLDKLLHIKISHENLGTFTPFLNSAKNLGSPQNKVDHIDSLKSSAQKFGPLGLIRKLWASEITQIKSRNPTVKVVEYGVL